MGISLPWFQSSLQRGSPPCLSCHLCSRGLSLVAVTCHALHLVAAWTCRLAALLGHPCKCGIGVTQPHAPVCLPGVGQQFPPE